MARSVPIRYQNNPARMGGKTWLGRKTFDDNTGGTCYEYELTTDDYGNRVAPRKYDSFDIDHRKNG